MKRTTLSERALVLAPHGRDASLAAAILAEADIAADPCPTLAALIAELDKGAAFALVAEEAIGTADLAPLAAWLADQQPWSDFPFVVMTSRGGIERNPQAKRHLETLGNAAFLERPFHPTTLVSLARAALRSRRRQYEARARLEALRESEDHYRNAVELNPQVAWTALPDGQLDHVSHRWFEWTGTTGLGETWAEGLHAEDREKTFGAWARSVESGEPYDVEHRIKRRDGTFRWARSRAYPRRDGAGPIVKWYGTTEDIHVRRSAEAAVAESEARFRAAVDTVHGILWTNDAEGRMTGEQPGWAALTGQTPEQYHGYGWADAVHPDDADPTVAAWEEAVREEKAFVFEHRVRTSGGVWRRFAIRATPLRDERGAIREWVGVHTDVTNLRDAEQAAAAERDRQRLMLQRMPGFAAFLEEPDHRHVYMNDAYVALVGQRMFQSRPVREVFPELEGQGFFELLDRVRATGERYSARALAIRFAQDGGRERFVDLVLEPVRDDSGAVRGVFLSGYDVTELTETQAQLRRLNDNLAQRVAELAAQREEVWRNSRDLIVIADDAGLVYAVSPSWTTTLGWKESELLGRRFFDLIHSDDRQNALSAFEGMKARPRDALRFEARHRARDERWVWLSWSGAAHDGRLYAFGRDVTDDKQRAEALRQAEDALRQAQKVESLGHLTGGVAHDFNNLLAAILSNLDLARKRIDDERARKLIDGAVKGAERGAALTKRLLAFARRQELKAEAVDVRSLFEGMRDLLERSLGPLVRITADLPPDLPPILVDPHQLELALLNIAVNARDAMPAGGSLHVEASARHAPPPTLAAGPYVRIRIADTGEGMDAQTLKRATEPFFTTKGVGKGTGLGLPMAYGLAAQSGGLLELASEPGRGTTVAIWLPQAERLDRKPPSAPAAEAAAVDAAALKVLVVDDDALVMMGTTAMLEDLGHAVIEAGSGQKALDLLAEVPDVDVVITDHAMPGMNGAELARRIGREHPGLPVILASGYAELPGGQGAALLRLAKPFRQDELAVMIDRALERAGG